VGAVRLQTIASNAILTGADDGGLRDWHSN
jgi:hypothetical protein